MQLPLLVFQDTPAFIALALAYLSFGSVTLHQLLQSPFKQNNTINRGNCHQMSFHSKHQQHSNISIERRIDHSGSVLQGDKPSHISQRISSRLNNEDQEQSSSRSASSEAAQNLSSVIQAHSRQVTECEQKLAFRQGNAEQKQQFSNAPSKLSKGVGSKKSKLSLCRSEEKIDNSRLSRNSQREYNSKIVVQHLSPKQSVLKQNKALIKNCLNQQHQYYNLEVNNNPSRLSSRINPSVKPQTSKLIQQQSYLRDKINQDIINGPDYNPHLNSFHLNTSQSIDCLGQKDRCSFKDVLEIKYEGIDAHHKELALLQSKSFFKNILKSPRSYSKSNRKSFYQQSGQSKKTIESQYKIVSQHEENQDSKKIQTFNDSEYMRMQEKLRELQKQKMAMQMKLVIKQNEIRSLKCSTVYGSQKNVQFSNTPTDSRFWPLKEQENSGVRSRSRRKVESQFQREIQAIYQQYLDNVKGSTFRKNLIRSKSLAHNSDELQIGCISQLLNPIGQNDGTLEVVLLVTFHSFLVSDFNISLVHDSAFRSETKPQKIAKLQPRKQYKIFIKLKVMRVPFHYPEVEITYRASEEYNSKYLRVVLPLSFNKFVQFMPFHNQNMQNDDVQRLRTNEFRLNSKNIPLDRIAEYLAEWTLLSSQHVKTQLIMGANCLFLENRFKVLLHLSENEGWIEGQLISGDPTVVEFFICTMKDIFCLKKK